MVNELLDKVAIVTGGASGIGAGIVEKFLSEGARVVIADIERDRGEGLAGKLGGDAVFRSADVSNPEHIGALVAGAVETFGRLDIMVNNAGVSSKMHRSFLDAARGARAGTRAAGRQRATSGGGSIINMSSIGGIQAGGGVMTYRASKAAVIMFTKSAAIELAHYEVRVNAIAPGNIPTPLLQTTTTDKSPEELARFEHAIGEQMRADRPLKREGTPDDIAEAALYLASDRSRYVTGTVLPVDGGTVAGKAVRRRSDQNN